MMRANELVALINEHGKRVGIAVHHDVCYYDMLVEVNEILEHIDDIKGFVSLLSTFKSPSGPLQINLMGMLNNDCKLYCWHNGDIALIGYGHEQYRLKYGAHLLNRLPTKTLCEQYRSDI